MLTGWTFAVICLFEHTYTLHTWLHHYTISIDFNRFSLIRKTSSCILYNKQAFILTLLRQLKKNQLVWLHRNYASTFCKCYSFANFWSMKSKWKKILKSEISINCHWEEKPQNKVYMKISLNAFQWPDIDIVVEKVENWDLFILTKYRLKL